MSLQEAGQTAGHGGEDAGARSHLRLRRVLRTTSFRIALLYLGLFVFSVIAIEAAIYGSTIRLIDQQTEATIRAEAEGLREVHASRGGDGLSDAITARAAAPRNAMLYFLVGVDGAILAGNIDSWPYGLEFADADERWFDFEAFLPEGGSTPQMARGYALLLPDGLRLLVARDLRERDFFGDRLLTAVLWSLSGTVALGLGGGMIVSRNVRRRLDNVNRLASRIMNGALGERIALSGGGDELDELSANLNAMLDRIADLMAGLRQVSESVAHDLRTPLTRLRARLELAAIDPPDREGTRQLLSDAIADLDQLLATFRALLDIAAIEAGQRAVSMSDVDLAAVAFDVAELYEPLAEAKGQSFRLSTPADPVWIRGDAHLAARAIANLLDNAIKYAPEGGRVALELWPEPQPTLVVRDNGPGIPKDQRERVLDRFVRLEASRSTPGSGLGLSLVRAVAKLHGATLSLSDGAPGLVVMASFPLHSERKGDV